MPNTLDSALLKHMQEEEHQELNNRAARARLSPGSHALGGGLLGGGLGALAGGAIGESWPGAAVGGLLGGGLGALTGFSGATTTNEDTDEAKRTLKLPPKTLGQHLAHRATARMIEHQRELAELSAPKTDVRVYNERGYDWRSPRRHYGDGDSDLYV